MRPQTKNIFPVFFNLDSESTTENQKVNKNVQHYCDLYKTFDEYLNQYSELEQLAHEDLKQLCKWGIRFAPVRHVCMSISSVKSMGYAKTIEK